jgi:hypothetical protein
VSPPEIGSLVVEEDHMVGEKSFREASCSHLMADTKRYGVPNKGKEINLSGIEVSQKSSVIIVSQDLLL